MRNLLIMLDVNIHKQEKVEHTKGVIKSHKYLPFAQDMYATFKGLEQCHDSCMCNYNWLKTYHEQHLWGRLRLRFLLSVIFL
jgi:hypothetical protein